VGEPLAQPLRLVRPAGTDSGGDRQGEVFLDLAVETGGIAGLLDLVIGLLGQLLVVRHLLEVAAHAFI
jgi:hypothetical protein